MNNSSREGKKIGSGTVDPAQGLDIDADVIQSDQLLDENLFPNGNVYYMQNRKENVVIIHNNWMIGIYNKIEHFKNEGYWYV